MPARRQYTRELLAAVQAAAERYADHWCTQGATANNAPPRLRVMAGAGEGVPVAYAPRSKSDPRPWVEYNPADGSEVWRYNGRSCWPVEYTADQERIPGWDVRRSVMTRCRAQGVTTWGASDSAGTYCVYVFADGSEVTWSGESADHDVSNLHPVSEHHAFSAMWSELGDQRDAVRLFETSRYDDDSTALVQWIVSLAEEHGRAEQEYSSDSDADAAAVAEWQARTGSTITALDDRADVQQRRA